MMRAAFLLLGMGLGIRCLGAATYTWLPTAPGRTWSNGTNWDPNGVPNSSFDSAVIGPNGAYAGMLEINLDLDVTLNTLELSPPSEFESFDFRLDGSNTLTLTNALTVDAGIAVSIGGPVQLPSTAIFSVASSDYLEFRTLLGPGGVELIGGGRLRFVGSGAEQSSYSGATRILHGVYEAGVADPTFSPNSAVTVANDPGAVIIIQNTAQTLLSLEGGGNLGGNIGLGTTMESGSLTVGDATDRTYAGRIVGAWTDGPAKGRVIKQGTGTWTLAGANTHDEGTFLNQGGLIAADSQAFGTGLVEMAPGTRLGLKDGITITNPIQLSVVPSASPVVLEVPSGRGTIAATMNELGAGASFEKRGAGTLVANGTSHLSGISRVVEGRLEVNGDWTSCQLLVDAGASLGGSGTLGEVDVYGRLRPGGATDAIRADSLTFMTGSRYIVETNSSAASGMTINHTLSFEPGVTLEVIDRRGPPSLTPKRIATAGAMIGQFSQVVSSPRVKATVRYGTNAIDLFLDPIYWTDLLAAEGCCCCETLATAAYLDALYFSSERFSDDLDRVFRVLNLATPNQLACVLPQLSGGFYSVMPVAQQYTTLQVLQGIEDRLDQKRTLMGAPWSQGTAHSWATVLGHQAHQTAAPCAWDYCGYDTGLLLGLDVQGQSWMTGLAFSYSSLHLKAAQGHVRATDEAFYGHAYGRWNGEHLFGDVVIGGGYGFNRVWRDYFLSSVSSSLSREACSHFGGEQFDLHVGLGSNATMAWIDWALIASLDYLHLSQPDFQELGAGALNLALRSFSSDLVRGEISLWASHAWRGHVPQLGLAVAYDWRPERHLSSRLAEFCDSRDGVCCPAWAPDRWLFIPRAKWTELLSDRYSISLSYEGQFARNYWQNSLWLELGYAF